MQHPATTERNRVKRSVRSSQRNASRNDHSGLSNIHEKNSEANVLTPAIGKSGPMEGTDDIAPHHGRSSMMSSQIKEEGSQKRRRAKKRHLSARPKKSLQFTHGGKKSMDAGA